MTQAKGYMAKVDKWIFETYKTNDKALSLYRILYALFLLLFGVPDVSWIAQDPDFFFQPPSYSVAAFFDGFPSYAVLQAISLGTVMLSIFLLFGWRAKYTSLALGLLILLGKSFAYSFGKIDNDILVWMVPIVMAFSSWGKHYSIDGQNAKGSNNWPISMMALLLAFGMFTSAIPKLLGGWLDLSTQATRGHFFTQYFVIGDLKMLAPWLVQQTNPIMWEIMDQFTVWFELAFIISFIKTKYLRGFILLAILFHLINYLIFNIPFHFQFIVYLLFINWSKVPETFYNKLSKLSGAIINMRTLIITLVLYMPLYILAQQLMHMPGSLAPSPLMLLSQTLGLDHVLTVGTLVLLTAMSIITWQVTSKSNS